MKKLFKLLLILVALVVFTGFATVLGFYIYLKPQLPDVETLKSVELQTPMHIYTRDGKLISSFGVERREPVSIDEIPQQLKNAIIATEDSRFYSHHGFDPIGIARAVMVMMKSGSASEGASTITQQLARNFYLSNDKRIMRKIKELFIAVHIEQVLSKDEIMELYLNKIFLGHSSYGVSAAAFTYFGKTLDELTLGEIAVIAGLPKSPSKMNPIYSIERAKSRRYVVLLRMLDEGYITQEEFEAANAEELTGKKHGIKVEVSAQYVAEMARLWAIKHYGKEVETSGIKIYTTIDSHLQNAATAAAIGNLYRYDERHGYRGPSSIAWQEDQTPMTVEQMDDYLSSSNGKEYNTNVYGLLRPAIVTAVGEKEVNVYIKGRGANKIEWDGLKWARSFKTDRSQGPAPKTASDILKVGQQIWVRPMNTLIEVPEEETENIPDGTQDLVETEVVDVPVSDEILESISEPWKLSQIPEASTAFVAVDHNNGSVLALVGGFNYYFSNFNIATQSVRQAGSSIKPFIYAAAIEQEKFGLGSIVLDDLITKWDVSTGQNWIPKNSPPTYNGPTTIRRGLAQSKNVMAVRVLRAAGLDYVVEFLPKFGFEPKSIPHAESIALGAGSITPLHMAQGISTFANGGYMVDSYFIDHVDSPSDKRLFTANPTLVCDNECPQTPIQIDDKGTIELPKQAEQIIKPQTAFLIRQAMYGNIWGGAGWSGTGWRAKALKRTDIGGKTGTTNKSVDTWYVGFGPDIAAAVWVGFSEGSRPLGRTSYNANETEVYNGSESGGTTALPAWIDFMKVALKDKPKKQDKAPEGIVSARIDLDTGLLTDSTSNSSTEYFTKQTVPTEYVPVEVDYGIYGGDDEDDSGGLW